MALKRLTGCAIVCILFLGLSAWAQGPSQDGVLLLEGFGNLHGRGATGSAANTLPALAQFNLGLNIARDSELVSDANGNAVGGYILDGFGGQYAFGTAVSPQNLAAAVPGSVVPFFGWDIARDIEVAPNWTGVTNAYGGYFILDGFGGVHAVGDVNLPLYPKATDETPVACPYPNTIIVAGQQGQSVQDTAVQTLQGGTITQESAARPIFPYFGWDIARDLEVSVQYVTLTTALLTNPDWNPAGPVLPSYAIVSTAARGRKIAMCNGYYILDGYGAVHCCRLPLQFDINHDGKIDDADIADPNFGQPANNLPLYPPWGNNCPYFGWDIARDIELTPSGNGFYMLDGYGTVYGIGEAPFNFANPQTPWFGVDIANGIEIVPTADRSGVAGYLVVDGFGTVWEAGAAQDYNINGSGPDGGGVFSFQDSFVDVAITPAYRYARSVPPKDTGFAVAVAPPGTDVTDPFVIWNPNLSTTIVPRYKVTTAPHPFLSYQRD